MRRSASGRGLSPVVGVALLVVVAVLLAVVATLSLTSLSSTALDRSSVHGTGAYGFEVSESGDEHLFVTPESVQSQGTTFNLRINGYEAYSWNGTSRLEITCLYPGDQFTIYTSEGSTTALVTTHTVRDPTGCSLGITERFEYAFVNGKKVVVGEEYAFGLAIDPDGPGSDRTFGNPVDQQRVGPVPLSNDWHHSERFDRTLHGISPPVWLFVLTDNVHWDTAPAYQGGLNWTDAPPAGRDPGSSAYSVSGSTVSPINDPSTEPTNDVYLLFKPGCDGSEVKLIDNFAGYENQILLDGTVVVPDASDPSAVGTTFAAPAIPCYD